MKIILHIGSEKTGSTSIQAALEKHRSYLQSKGICYPDWSDGPAKGHLVAPLFFGTANMTAQLFDITSQENQEKEAFYWAEWERIEKSIAETSPDTLVLSSELLFRPLSATADKIIGRLLDMSSEIEIISYLRPPNSFAISFICQSFKQGLFLDLEFLTQKIDYTTTLMSYIQAFDKKMTVYEYGPRLMVNNSIVGHFFETVLDVPMPEGAEPIFWNVTPSPEGLEIIQKFFSTFHQKDIWYYSDADFRTIGKLLQIEKELGKTPITLTRKASRWLEKCTHQNTWLKQEFGIDFGTDQEAKPDPASSLPTGKIGLQDIFVLDENRSTALHAKIKTEMPAFWAAYGDTFYARLHRTKQKLRRRKF